MKKLNKKELKEILLKIEDFSAKFPLIRYDSIDVGALADNWGMNRVILKNVFIIMTKMHEKDLFIEEIDKVYIKDKKIKIKLIDGTTKEIKKTED